MFRNEAPFRERHVPQTEIAWAVRRPLFTLDTDLDVGLSVHWVITKHRPTKLCKDIDVRK